MPQERHIEIEVITADALWFDVDVLVLKHAQVSFGADAAAKQLLGLDPRKVDLAPGGRMICPGRPSIGAEKVVFLGVPPLEEFGYSEIRLFARRAMSLVAEELPEARQIALTLHGAGFGLDEIACFDAELAGLQDAFELQTVPPALERVAIVESNVGRAERLRERLAMTLPDGYGSASVSVSPGSAPGEGLAEGDLAAPSERDHAFVAMPFSSGFEDVFHYGIAAAVRENGLLCERIDQAVFTGDILTRMKERIRTATLLVADLTDANPNVYLEVGFAWAAGVPTVLVHHADSELKFDVQGERCLSYSSIKELEERLTGELRQLVA